MADGIISPDEEDSLKEFDNQMAPTAVRPDTNEDSDGNFPNST